MNFIRTKCSGQKNRLIQGKYNLDLTYITPRLIAMGFPSSGIHTIYRNNITDVANYLNENIDKNYLLINVSENTYDSRKFNGNVLHFNQWLDHHSPPLHLLFELVEKIYAFLFSNHSNIVVVNCNAGKGRTGSLIFSFLLYSGCFSITQDAFDYYSLKRFKRGHGLTHASQRRYVEYFFNILQDKQFPIPILRKLKSIKIKCAPYQQLKHIIPKVYIYNNSHEIIYSNCKKEKKPIDCSNNKEVVFCEIENGISIYGDILIELFHVKGIFSKTEKLGRVAFNTSCIDINSNEIRFKLHQIDPYEFTIKPNVKKDYEIILTFENKCEKDKDNIKQCDDLCDECKEIMKNELSKISKCQSVVNRYSPEEVKIGQKLLFGEKQSDIESTLQNRGSLINIDNIVYNNLDDL